MAKKRKIELIGTIESGSINYESGSSNLLGQFLCKNEGKNIEITIKIVNDMKTYQQLKFYYGAILPAMVKATGETDIDRIDNFLKGKYLSEIIEIGDGIAPYVPSKSDLDKIDMKEFIEDCLLELIECGGEIVQDKIVNYRDSQNG